MSKSDFVLDAWQVPVWTDMPDRLESVRVGFGAADGGVLPSLRYPLLGAEEAAALAVKVAAGRDTLLSRPAAEIARTLGRVGRRFLDPADPLRVRALDLLPVTAGISPPMAIEILDGMARDWTPERLEATLVSEFGSPGRLDGVNRTEGGDGSLVIGEPLGVHIVSGSVPGVSATTLVRSLMVKSPVIVKPGQGDVALPLLWLQALAEADDALARAAAVLYWPGGESACEDTLFREATVVVVYGSDATVTSVRRRIPPSVRLVTYPHRISVALVGREALGHDRLARTASAAARAVAVFDQRGCVSPRVIYVEAGGEASTEEFAGALAEALAALDRELPPGELDPKEASSLLQLRGAAELRSAAGEPVIVRSSQGSSWTVVSEPGATLEPSWPGRTVRVEPLGDATELPPLLELIRGPLQTVALAGLGDRAEDLALSAFEAGALRVTTLERAPWPPAWWHHDGAGPLTVLTRTVDVEG